jgi:long-chain acyl-CoA synthetase
MPNIPEYLAVLFSTWHAGLVAVPINCKLHEKELAWILQDCGAEMLFTVPELGSVASAAAADTMREIIEVPSRAWSALLRAEPHDPAEVMATDLAWLFYTSGTTGRPKGAMLSHANLLAMTTSYLADVDAVTAEDCMIHCAPLSHGSGLYALPHIARAATHVFPMRGGFDEQETLELIEHWPNGTLFLAPTMVRRIVTALGKYGGSTENLKTIVYGGGPMYVQDLLRALQVLGPRLAQIYGQGEAPMTITSMTRDMHIDRGHPDHLKRLASVGLPRTDVDVRVAAQDGRALPAGEIGEVLVRGPVVMSGYWRNGRASGETLRDGWLHTGDLGSFDEHGFLTLAGRSKEVIISGGSNIYPREVEDVLLLHQAVTEAAVIGLPDPHWGEEVVAFVVCPAAGQVDVEELNGLCLKNLARFKRPRRYFFVDRLPRNHYGKVLKSVLKDQTATAPGLP